MAIVEGGARVSIQSQKKSTLLAQKIVNKIVDEGLGEGDRLAPEAEMCDYYGVGRSTIREALRLLENQGVIKIKTGPGGGPIVSGFDAGFLAGNIALHLQLSGATFRDVMNARMVIEPRIAASAAGQGRADAIGALRENVSHSHEASEDRGLLVAESARFHDLVAASSDNPFFEYLLLALHRITEPFAQRLSYHEERRERLIGHHEEILAAIEAGSPEKAAAAMEADLLEFFDYVEQEAPQLFDEPIEWSRITT